MIIGVPKEIKPQEHRIGLTPESVKTLTAKGHEVLVQKNAGYESGFYNEDYIKSGAQILDNAKEIYFVRLLIFNSFFISFLTTLFIFTSNAISFRFTI